METKRYVLFFFLLVRLLPAAFRCSAMIHIALQARAMELSTRYQSHHQHYETIELYNAHRHHPPAEAYFLAGSIAFRTHDEAIE